MKAEGYIWNDEYVSRAKSFNTKGKVSFIITTKMCQNFIEKVGTKNYTIERLGSFGLSNKERECIKVTIEMPLIFIEQVLEKLNLTSDGDRTFEYYRYSMEKQSKKYVPFKYWVFNSKTKISALAENTPFKIQKKGANIGELSLKHFVIKKI